MFPQGFTEALASARQAELLEQAEHARLSRDAHAAHRARSQYVLHLAWLHKRVIRWRRHRSRPAAATSSAAVPNAR